MPNSIVSVSSEDLTDPQIGYHPQNLIGRRVLAWTVHGGTYGMGGPGFFGLELDHPVEEWLILKLWSSGHWIKVNGERYLECDNPWEGLFSNINCNGVVYRHDDFSPLLGFDEELKRCEKDESAILTDFQCNANSCKLVLNGNITLEILEDFKDIVQH